MTVDEFDEWIETTDGQDEYYEWLYDNYPELNKGGLFSAHENGYDIEGFMDHKGVELCPNT
jgi:hypothetical protein